MSKKTKKLSSQEIDNVVTAEADNLTKWGKPVHVKPARMIPLFLEPELIDRAKLLARRKRIGNYRSWLKEVIRERIRKEELGKRHSSSGLPK